MKTPICDFVEKYACEGKMRLHMPGHKGVPFLGVEDRDITEVEGADVLYNSDGIITESENNASMLFGSGKTLYSTEGSSLCIRAMIYLLSIYSKKQGKRPLILAARNAHKTFTSAVALTGCDVKWIYPEGEEGNLISCRVSPERLEKILCEANELPTAVYLTSPDYLGAISNIRGIAEVCKKYGVTLAVDNAHGAYLRFLRESKHPIDLGADICCDSAHKTLPVLTGGAYLHISKNAPSIFAELASVAMSLFASTSPSYLILQSLDMANKYLAAGCRERMIKTADMVDELKNKLTRGGFSLIGDEGFKICIEAKKYGYLGSEIAAILLEKGIVCEFYDRDFVVMMFTPEICRDGFSRLAEELLSIPRKAAINEEMPQVGRPEIVMTVRDAMMSPSVELGVDESLGRALASANVSCPPAIPIILCGERIDENAIKCFKYYGIEKCRVVD